MKKNKSTRAKIGVARGFGPRHSENAKEGDTTDLTQIPSDSVPALLTPREAVLTRNAAELAGRDNIEALNAEGNKLARKGVDLAAKGQTSVAPIKGSKAVASGNVMKYVLPGELRREAAAGLPKLAEGTENMKTKKMQSGGQVPGGINTPGRVQPGPRGMPDPTLRPDSLYNSIGGGVPPIPSPYSTSGGGMPPSQVPPGYFPPGARPMPVPRPQPLPRQSGGFYPQGQGFASGTPDVAGIGQPNPQTAYDPKQQVDFKAPDLSGFMRAIQGEAKKQGISESQMAAIAKQFSGGFGGGGGALAGNYAAAGSSTPVYGESGYPSAIPVGGYQDGSDDISDRRRRRDAAMRNPYGDSDLMRPPDIEDLATVPSSLGEAERRRLLQEYLLSVPTYPPTKGYQGGISDIGYPPMLMPGAEYHADKGSSWVGPYDPAYLVQRYQGGTSDVWRGGVPGQSPF